VLLQPAAKNGFLSKNAQNPAKTEKIKKYLQK